MQSRRAPLIGGALLIAFAAVWLWRPMTQRAALTGITASAAPASTAPAPARAIHTSSAPRAARPSEAQLPLLPPEQRDATLRTVRGPVVGCISAAGLSTANMDPRMHARLRVGTRKEDGKAGIASFELVHGDSAPKDLEPCLEHVLAEVAIALPAGTEGYVITPPLAGTEAGKQPPSH